MYLVFDIETTGLVKCEQFNVYPPYTDLKEYDRARIIQIAWVVLDKDLRIKEQKMYLIKPNGFKIPKSKYHRLNDDICNMYGVDFAVAAMDLLHTARRCNMLISHNILFDVNVLMSYLYRYNLSEPLERVKKMYKFCTSVNSAETLQIPLFYDSVHNNMVYKYPSLKELYKFLFKSELREMHHDALYDSIICAMCFTMLQKIKASESAVPRGCSQFRINNE